MSFRIEDYQNMYKEAASKGDADGMQKANDGANAIRRQQGVAEQFATDHISSVRKKQQSNNTVVNNNSTLIDSYKPQYNSTGKRVASDEYNDVENTSTDGSFNGFNFSSEVQSLLQGRGSGKTAGDLGYNAYYTNSLNDLQSRYDSYSKAGNQGMANHYLEAIDRFKSDKSAMNLNQTTFKNWDTGLLDTYIQNKKRYELDNLSDVEKTQIAQTNKELREFYGMTEDNLTANDLGQLGADLLWGNFIQHGLESGEDVPQQYSLNGKMVDMPGLTKATSRNRDIAQQLARRDNLFGYEPLGRVTGQFADDLRKDVMNEETKMFDAFKSGQTYNPRSNNQSNQYNEINNNSGISSEIGEYISSTGGDGSNVAIQNTIPFDVNNPDAGGLYETQKGRFANINGKITEVSNDDWVEFMTQYYGF